MSHPNRAKEGASSELENEKCRPSHFAFFFFHFSLSIVGPQVTEFENSSPTLQTAVAILNSSNRLRLLKELPPCLAALADVIF
jgi:hypothetical protein